MGGTVRQVTYENTCVTGTKHALEFNPFYSSGNGSTTPYLTDIAVLGFKAVSSRPSAQSLLEGYDSSHPLGLTLENDPVPIGPEPDLHPPAARRELERVGDEVVEYLSHPLRVQGRGPTPVRLGLAE